MISAINNYNPNFNAKIKPNKVRNIVKINEAQLKGITKKPVRFRLDYELEKHGEAFLKGMGAATIAASAKWVIGGCNTENISSCADLLYISS